MTKLIVSLDGPIRQYHLACELIHAGVRWLKVGAQMVASYEFTDFVAGANSWPEDVQIFLDLKLADTAKTVRETVKRLADVGIAAISTFTREATEVAVQAAAGQLKIWQVLLLSDHVGLPISSLAPRCPDADGVICPAVGARIFQGLCDVVVPGVRLPGTEPNGHTMIATPQEAVAAGATHIVVGRPIWQAVSPVAAAQKYLAALESRP